MPEEFRTDTVLKRDIFSETRLGTLASRPGEKTIRREVAAAPGWSRPLAWMLARREIRAMRAAEGVAGTPQLVSVDRRGLYRSWLDGTPLHLARPADAAFYRDAGRLLRDLRRRGITHNDLAKPQNWLMTIEGRAAVIDFQLAFVHRRRGWLYRLMAYEDLRHLLKQKRGFAPHLLTPSEQRVLARRSLPSRLWLATGKKVYNLVTRGLIGWSDGEGTGDRIDTEGPSMVAALSAHPTVRSVALTYFPFPRKGVGVYAFAESSAALDEEAIAALRRTAHGPFPDLVQPVAELPRRADGTVREDILRLIAMNQMTELDRLVAGDPQNAAIAAAIAAGRLNMTDRRLSDREEAAAS